MTKSSEIDPATAEAIDWIVRLSSGDATQADVHALNDWRAERPEHDAAFRRLAALQPVTRALAAQPRPSRRAVLSGGGIALAGLATFGLMRPPLGIWPSLAELMADHRTGTGQRYAFAPTDGVEVEMNARTSVSLLAGRPGLRLIEGEAYIRVDRGSPFEIDAGDTRFLATAATLNVTTVAGGIRLACVAGTIDCRRGDRQTRLANGQEWRVAADGDAEVRTVLAHDVTSWRRGLLTFSSTPLGEVIEQFNRYRAAPIMLAGASDGDRPVSGIFYTDQIEGAITQLQQLLNLNRRSLPGGIIMLG